MRFFFKYLFLVVVLTDGIISEANAFLSHQVIDCQILDQKGLLLRQYEGGSCIFLPDGSVISGGYSRIVFYNPDMSVKWLKSIDVHHGINLSQDGKEILVLTSFNHSFEGEKVRFDKLLVFDLEGHEKKSYNFFDDRSRLQEITGPIPPYFSMPAASIRTPEVRFEFSHANSFYEIGPNTTASANPAFTPGNYVVNVNKLGVILVLDRSLKNILWHSTCDHTPGHFGDRHDVQMQENGKFLIYHNFAGYSLSSIPSPMASIADSVPYLQPFSAIEEMDPITENTTTLYQSVLPEQFFSESQGGVQILANHDILTNDNHPGRGGMAHEFTPERVQSWSMFNPKLNFKTGFPEGFLRIRRTDLSEFLKNNNGY